MRPILHATAPLALALVLSTASASVAQAALPGEERLDHRIPFNVGTSTSTLPTNRCGFPILQTVVANEYVVKTGTTEDGGTYERVTGRFFVTYSANDKEVTVNASGPFTQTVYPDGRRVRESQGRNVISLGPVSQANTGLTGLSLTTGFIRLKGAGAFATDFVIKGKVTDLCALLVP